MNYSAILKTFLGEALDGKQYKKLSSAPKVLAFIAVFPFMAVAAVLTIAYAILTFEFNLMSTTADYLEAWVDNKKKGVSWFGEGVLFMVALPTIFLYQIILASLSVAFYVIWFIMQCFFFVATLGGIKWTPYINKINLDEYKATKTVATTNRIAGNVVAIVLFAIFAFSAFLYFVNIFAESYELASAANGFSYTWALSAAITIPIVFKKKAESAVTDADDGDDDDDDDGLILPTI